MTATLPASTIDAIAKAATASVIEEAEPAPAQHAPGRGVRLAGHLTGVVGMTPEGLYLVDPRAAGVEVDDLSPLLERMGKSNQPQRAEHTFHFYFPAERPRRPVRIERDASGGLIRLVPEDNEEGTP